MAKSPDKTDKNAPDAAAAASADTAPTPRQIVVHAQYVKDLSFENPNAPEILIEPPTQPDVEIGVNVNARALNDEQYEVTLMLSAKAKSAEKALFLAEVSYCAIVSDVTRDGGFMPLSIQPIDFVAVYQSNMEAQQAGATGNGAAADS